MNLSNEHHDGNGKFAAHTKERERILRNFQFLRGIEPTGTLDTDTKDLLQEMNKAANE